MTGKPSKIKILFTIPNFDTAGSGKALFKIASGLNRDIFEPHIACLHDRGEFADIVKASGIPLHIFAFTHKMRPVLKGLKDCWRKSRFFVKHDFDIVHSFHYGSDYSEALSVKMAGVKWVFTKKNMNWGGSSQNGWRLRSFLSNCIAIQNSNMKKEFYPNVQKTKLVPRGVDISEFYPVAPDEKLRAELGIPDSTKVILNVANMAPVKGLEILIEAFSNISDMDVVLFLVGDNKNSYGEKLVKLVKKLNLEDKVIFPGKRLDIVRFLSIADLFVLTSRKEGSSVALLEAMAVGVPVLGTKVPGILDQLNNFPQLLVPYGDVDILSEKLRSILGMNGTELKTLKNNLISEVNHRFTIRREIADHEKMYLNLLKVSKTS
jgi:glycosyltransferase involved in cell wall biosynthesis